MKIYDREIKGAIFDLDGVIVDSAKYHFLAWKVIADELGITFTEKDNELLKGVSRDRSLEILLSLGPVSVSDDEFKDLAFRKNQIYVDFISKMDKDEILPGVLDFFRILKKNEVKIALGSASKNAVYILDRVDLLDDFDAIVDGTNVSKAKPDPEVFTLGAKMLGLEYKDCCVFEDSEAGIEAANTAGMLSIGIGDKKVLKDADIVIGSFLESNTIL